MMRFKVLTAVLMCMTMAAVVVRAHETTYMGTIEFAEKSRVRVRTVNAEGKVADKATLFTVTDTTKVTRSDKAVAFADAAPKVGERIVVVVAHGDEAGTEWTCSMHPHIAEEKAGQCPVCKMTLKERERPAKASQIKLAAT
jgi:hypothetical protein